MAFSNAAAARLVQDCKIMRERVAAILNCESAIGTLSEDDVFGKQYRELLQEDVRSLSELIADSEAELGFCVRIPKFS